MSTKNSVINEIGFYVLTLSQNCVRLFACDRTAMQELEIPQMPSCMDDVVKDKSIQDQLQRHSGAGSSESIVHGHHGDTDFDKNNQEKFVRAIERAVSQYLQSQSQPLILAGVERIVSDYKHMNSYKNLSESFVHGSFDRTPEAEILEKVLSMSKN
jgi:uncharacterized membrane protein YccC